MKHSSILVEYLYEFSSILVVDCDACTNLAVKSGWNHDPGYLGPFLIIISIHLIIALFNAKNRSGS